MRRVLLVLVPLTLAVPAGAQQVAMPGMHMPEPAPAKAKPKAKPKPAVKPEPKPRASAASPTTAARPAHQMPHGDHAMPMATPPQPSQAAPVEPSPMEPMRMGPEDAAMPGMTQQDHGNHSMTGALGAYPMTRESSGTAWQPDASEHAGLMRGRGDWTFMAHGALNLVVDHQSGPRGDDKVFASGMVMGMARRPVGKGTLQLRAGVSPDPLMGARGYPLLLASGETANGRDRLIDRQHPHDLVTELSASLSQNLGRNSSLFVYGGLPGEPAFGPPAFMHRESIMDSPEAPITHHWLDSTHISFGVLTAGLVLDRVKLEVSRFNGREPDQHRYDIETAPLDSTAARLSWNPTPELSLQGSWAHLTDPEQLEPGVDQRRWSASLLFAREVAPGWKLAGTLAWGRRTVKEGGQSLRDDALAAEASLKRGPWTMFGRGELAENRELVAAAAHGPAYRVGKVSLGAVRDFRVGDHWSVGAGGLFSVNFVPAGLAPAYGSRNPTGAMAFIRIKLQ